MGAKKFKQNLDWLIKNFVNWERRKGDEKNFQKLRFSFFRKIPSFACPEISLYYHLFDLFALKSKQLTLNQLFSLLYTQKLPCKYIGFLGPLGVGKSTLANLLVKKLSAEYVIKEPYRKNPFWKKSQVNPSFMLRSQVYFLISNIFSDMKAQLRPKTTISDTSTLTDILMWVDWYYQIGHFTKNDYQTYQKLVMLLKEVIPLPDLLIILLPDSTENLYNGIRQRQEREPWRKGELVFSQKDLAAQTEKVTQISQKITKDWRVKKVIIKVNPILLHTSFLLQEECLRKIRRRLRK